jgi:succinate dehydrogenase / fumarate reductase flavoprotein subunit
MFDDIPANYRDQTADTPEEGWKYTQGDKNARRPPELLTRDHVARCIVREVKEGRGSPHGGVFLDIAWIREKLSNSEDHIRRKLPSMYHQFKQLAGIDITKEPMEVGPTTHYTMGGIRVDAETQMSTVPGLFAAGEVAAGLHGANRLGGNSLSDLLVFGKRAGEFAARYANEHGQGTIDAAEVEEASRQALEPFSREGNGEGPYAIQYELQDTMQELAGIVRRESEMEQAFERVGKLRRRAATVAVPGNREYNPGWHTALDLDNLLTVSEALIRAGIARRESRGAHFRDDYPDKDPAFSTFNYVLRKGADGEMVLEESPISPVPPELAQVIEDQKK